MIAVQAAFKGVNQDLRKRPANIAIRSISPANQPCVRLYYHFMSKENIEIFISLAVKLYPEITCYRISPHLPRIANTSHIHQRHKVDKTILSGLFILLVLTAALYASIAQTEVPGLRKD